MAKKDKALDLDAASREELVAEIRRLRTSRDAVSKHNQDMTKYANKVNEFSTMLAVEGSLIFQAMAEKAGVRAHPSVTKVVEFFDGLAHVQWQKELPDRMVWPEDWNFDADREWTGDADMQLNAPIAALLEFIQSWTVSKTLSKPQRSHLAKCVAAVEQAMLRHIDGIKTVHGFVGKTVSTKDAPRGIGMAILDLAQDMSFANEMLRRDLRAASYRRICADLYRLSQCEFDEGPDQFDVKVLGGSSIPF